MNSRRSREKATSSTGLEPTQRWARSRHHTEQEGLMDVSFSAALETCGRKSALNPAHNNSTRGPRGFVTKAALIQRPKPGPSPRGFSLS